MRDTRGYEHRVTKPSIAKIDVIIIGDDYLDVNLMYAKKNRDLINRLHVLADCMEAEITTYISKINRVGMPDGKWSFVRVLESDSFGITIDSIFAKGNVDAVVLNAETKHGIFEKMREDAE